MSWQLPAVRQFSRDPLAIVEQARATLLEVDDASHAKQIADQADAIGLLLRRAGAAVEVLSSATAIAVWSRRRIGELTIPMERARAGRPGRTGMPPGSGSFRGGKLATLAALGLSSSEVSRCEALARVTEDVIAKHIAQVAAGHRRLTLGGTIAAVSAGEAYESDEWNTDHELINVARKVMGAIDCDPATNARAQRTIRARVYWTKEQDGLRGDRRWRGRVWCNPPYSRGLVDAFASRFLDEFDAHHMTRGLLLLNSSTDVEWFHKLGSRLPFVLTKGRRSFIDARSGKVHNQNRTGQVLFAAGLTARQLEPMRAIGLVCGAT